MTKLFTLLFKEISDLPGLSGGGLFGEVCFLSHSNFMADSGGILAVLLPDAWLWISFGAVSLIVQKAVVYMEGSVFDSGVTE